MAISISMLKVPIISVINKLLHVHLVDLDQIQS